jgi:hypothetical protein
MIYCYDVESYAVGPQECEILRGRQLYHKSMEVRIRWGRQMHSTVTDEAANIIWKHAYR